MLRGADFVNFTLLHRKLDENAQDMRKICARYAQDMRKICARYAQDMVNVTQTDMRKICACMVFWGRDFSGKITLARSAIVTL